MHQVRGVRRVGIVASNSPSYIDAMLGCIEKGHVAVPLRSRDDNERISASAISDFVTPEGVGGWLDRPFTSKDGDSIAQISFTSGTEGPPKGILLTHRALNDVHERLQDVMKLNQSVREYVGVPVYHSFGYARCRTICAVGGKAFIPASGFRPSEIASMLRGGEINAISAVPSLWRLLMASADLLKPGAEKVRWIEIGSQYMSGLEKNSLRALFPNATIIQHYGLTEASRSTLLEVHSAHPAHLESVGKPTGFVQIKVDNDERISIKGPHLSCGMLIEGRECPLTDREGWFRTSDLGHFEEDYLFFDGRADDVINCGGIKVHPETLEKRIYEILHINEGFAVSRMRDALRGDGVLVSRELSSSIGSERLRDAAIEALKEHGLQAAAAVMVHDVPVIPKTETGKIRRRHLTEMLQREVGKDAMDCVRQVPGNSFREVISRCLGLTSIDPNSSFAQLGGDSLSHIQVALALEQVLGHIPGNWASLTIAELEGLVERGAKRAFDVSIVGRLGPQAKAPPLPQGEINRNPEGVPFWSLVREDYATNGRSIFAQGFVALFINRFGNWRMSIRWRLFRAPLTALYFLLAKLCQVFCGIKLDYTVAVGRRVKIEHFGGMILGARRIGSGVIIRQNTTIGIRHVSDLNAKPIIEDNVDIGAGAVIVGNITVGHGSIIGANSVVNTDVPSYSLVEGNPARITRMNLVRNLSSD